jgi:acyl carrier protein
MTLLDRVLGRLSGDGRTTAPGAPPPAATREAPAPSDPAAASGATDRRASVIRTLQDHVAEGSRGRLSAKDVEPQGPLFDRGYLDSFSYVTFLAFIEEKYGVRIDDSQLAGHLTTIAAMADHIVREKPSPGE